MITTDLPTYLKIQGQHIEEQLDRLISLRRAPHQHLFEAARYALLGGGKRLRPILTLATVELLGGNPSSTLSPACTLELVHTYSMIHDDLPCMDNDDYRRGKLTVHRKYTEGEAVLAGDFLLTYAFEILATDPHLRADQKVALIETLARLSGSEGMIGGQVMDLAYAGRSITLEELRELHKKKTGALILAALEFGAIIGNASSTQYDCLRQFGEWIGLAFQVIDDILDVTASEVKHGRQIGSDTINKKCTYVSLLGIERAQAYALNCYDQAIRAVSPLPSEGGLLVRLAEFMVHRNY